MTDPRSKGYVYVFTTGRGHVKIGWSRAPETRLAQINVVNAEPLFLVGYIEGSKSDERNIQKRLSGWRLHNDWFWHKGDVAAFVASVAAHGLRAAA